MAATGRIKRKFSELRARGEAALIPFIVAGDPDMDTTRRLVLELEEYDVARSTFIDYADRTLAEQQSRRRS